MAAEAGRQGAVSFTKQLDEFGGEISEVVRVERSDMGEEQGSISEVFGDGGVGGDAGDGGEAMGGLFEKEVKGGVELVAEKEELRLVAFRVALHFGLECW